MELINGCGGWLAVVFGFIIIFFLISELSKSIADSLIFVFGINDKNRKWIYFSLALFLSLNIIGAYVFVMNHF